MNFLQKRPEHVGIIGEIHGDWNSSLLFHAAYHPEKESPARRNPSRSFFSPTGAKQLEGPV